MKQFGCAIFVSFTAETFEEAVQKYHQLADQLDKGDMEIPGFDGFSFEDAAHEMEENVPTCFYCGEEHKEGDSVDYRLLSPPTGSEEGLHFEWCHGSCASTYVKEMYK